MTSGPSTLIKDHLAGGASRLAALLLPYILPVCSVVAPCHPGAALRDLVLVQRGRATRHPLFVITLALVTGATAIAAAQHPAMPPGMTHEDHLAQTAADAALKQRGAAAMGFDQDKTTHHFRLTPEGGAIEVSVNDPSDDGSRAQVRAHLKQIAIEFALGSFDKPFATHGETPPGVRTLQARTSRIAYVYTDLPNGGRVTIDTKDRTARTAVHQFLRYQIREHATGDPTAVR